MNANTFIQIGTVVGGDSEPSDWPGGSGGIYNCADAGPINFSCDGERMLLGNGNGGCAPYGGPWYSGTVELQHSGRIWSMPVAGGSVSHSDDTQLVGNIGYHTDFLPLPTTTTIPDSDGKYFVNHGTDYSGSSSNITVFDETTGETVTVITNGPGATTSLVFNPTNERLYAGVGFGDNRGKIYSFSLDQLDQAFHNDTPLNFATDGILFNPTAAGNNSGAGLFFSNNGYLFAGGNEGITCFKPDGTVSRILDLEMPGYYDYTSLIYNPANDQFLAAIGGNIGLVFNASDFESVPEPSTLVLILTGLAALAWRCWRRRR